MSSFLYPDSATRKLYGIGKNSYTSQFKRAKHRESMMERARRLTAEKLAMGTPAVAEKTFFQKVKSRVTNFLKSFLK